MTPTTASLDRDVQQIIATLETMSDLLTHVVEQLERYEPLLQEAERRLSTPSFTWRKPR